MEDQRRRTLEALERRFAQAKAEVQTQQQKSKKRPAEDKEKVASNVESSPADSAVKKPFSDSSSRKGLSLSLAFVSWILLLVVHAFLLDHELLR